MFSATASPVTPWNVPAFLSATAHLAMTQLPELAAPAMGAYLGEVRRLNYGLGTAEAGAGTVRSATLFSPYELLFGFRPRGTGASARAGIQTVHDDWALDVEVVRDDDNDYFSIHPGTTSHDETVLVANIGAALLAAGHIPQMLLAWNHVRAQDLKDIYNAAEAEVMRAQADRMLSGGRMTRFDLLVTEICSSAEPVPETLYRLWNLCRLMIVPPEGHCAGYAFQFPGYAADDGWKGRADLCTQLLAVGAARLIGLDHVYEGISTAIPDYQGLLDTEGRRLTTRQFGDAWLIGFEVFFSPDYTPTGSDWEPPVIRVGDEVLPLFLHQFERARKTEGPYRARFAAAHRLDLRPGDHKLQLAVHLRGRDIKQEFNYRVPDRR